MQDSLVFTLKTTKKEKKTTYILGKTIKSYTKYLFAV